MPHWATKAQFSTELNWAFLNYGFFSVYFSLTDALSRWILIGYRKLPDVPVDSCFVAGSSALWYINGANCRKLRQNTALQEADRI